MLSFDMLLQYPCSIPAVSRRGPRLLGGGAGSPLGLPAPEGVDLCGLGRSTRTLRGGAKNHPAVVDEALRNADGPGFARSVRYCLGRQCAAGSSNRRGSTIPVQLGTEARPGPPQARLANSSTTLRELSRGDRRRAGSGRWRSPARRLSTCRRFWRSQPACYLSGKASTRPACCGASNAPAQLRSRIWRARFLPRC